jgi:hypothetical protein
MQWRILVGSLTLLAFSGHPARAIAPIVGTAAVVPAGAAPAATAAAPGAAGAAAAGGATPAATGAGADAAAAGSGGAAAGKGAADSLKDLQERTAKNFDWCLKAVENMDKLVKSVAPEAVPLKSRLEELTALAGLLGEPTSHAARSAVAGASPGEAGKRIEELRALMPVESVRPRAEADHAAATAPPGPSSADLLRLRSRTTLVLLPTPAPADDRVSGNHSVKSQMNGGK